MRLNKGILSSGILCAGLCFVSVSAKTAGIFELSDLPHGKHVTLNKPATTLIPADGSAYLTSTDLPQTLKLTAVSVDSSTKAQKVKIALVDREGKSIKYVELQPGFSYMYTYRFLTTIALVPQKGYRLSSMRIRVDSDKPLEIGR